MFRVSLDKLSLIDNPEIAGCINNLRAVFLGALLYRLSELSGEASLNIKGDFDGLKIVCDRVQAFELVKRLLNALAMLIDYQDDQEVVIAAVTQDINALDFASDELFENEGFIFKLLSMPGVVEMRDVYADVVEPFPGLLSVLNKTGPKLIKNREFIKKVLVDYGWRALSCFSVYWSDEEILRLALPIGSELIDEEMVFSNIDGIFSDDKVVDYLAKNNLITGKALALLKGNL